MTVLCQSIKKLPYLILMFSNTKKCLCHKSLIIRRYLPDAITSTKFIMQLSLEASSSPVIVQDADITETQKTTVIRGEKRINDQLHVSLVSETLPPDINGVAMTMGRLISGLRQANHRIDLVYPELTGTPGTLAESNVHGGEDIAVRGYPIPFYKSMKFGVSGTGAFLRKWADKKPDIVHIVTEGPLGVAAMIAARELRIPVVSGFHTNFHQYTGHYRMGALRNSVMKYLRWFHNKCNVTLVPTNALATELTESGINNVSVLSRGIDTTLFSPKHRSEELRREFGAQADDPLLLYVGRVAAEKNICLALSAFERFKSIEPAAKLVIVGDGPLLDQIRKHPTSPIVCGSKTGQELATHYASADIFLFPSLSETFGNVTLEAMASGLTVIAFDHAAAKEHIRHQYNGIKATQYNDDAYLEAVELLARQPALARVMGQNARLSVGNSDWSEICDTLISIYRGLIK